MYKVFFTMESFNNINDFIDSYFNSFINLFIDSWINNYDLIEKSYLDLSFKYRNNIYDKINNFFCEEVIWKKIIDNELYLSILSIWNFRLFIFLKIKIKKLDMLKKLSFIKNNCLVCKNYTINWNNMIY